MKNNITTVKISRELLSKFPSAVNQKDFVEACVVLVLESKENKEKVAQIIINKKPQK